VIAVGSGGTLSVLAMSLRTWLAHPCMSDVRIRAQGENGQVAEIDADLVGGKRVEALLRQALHGIPED
jgi:hypothetical protein